MTRRILYLQYASPALYPPVHHSARILAGRGWHVAFLGLEAGALGMPVLPRSEVRLLPSARAGGPVRRYLGFAGLAAASARRWRPDWIYVSDAPAAPAGLLASAVCGARVIYHEHDAPAAASGRLQPWTRRVLLGARRRLAQRAAVRVLPNARRLERFVRDCGLDQACALRTLCVWNCPGRAEAEPVERPTSTDPLVLHYQGSLNALRLPFALLEGLALVRARVRLQIVGYETVGHPGFVEQFRDRARSLGLGDRVAILPPVCRQEALDLARRADAGLAVVSGAAGDPNLQTLEGASNKAFEYLACGLPLIVPDTADWRGLYVEPGYGLACDPEKPQDVAGAAQWLADHRDEARAMGERGRQRVVHDWNYEAQFAPVLRLMEQDGAPGR